MVPLSTSSSSAPLPESQGHLYHGQFDSIHLPPHPPCGYSSCPADLLGCSREEGWLLMILSHLYINLRNLWCSIPEMSILLDLLGRVILWLASYVYIWSLASFCCFLGSCYGVALLLSLAPFLVVLICSLYFCLWGYLVSSLGNQSHRFPFI